MQGLKKMHPLESYEQPCSVVCSPWNTYLITSIFIMQVALNPYYLASILSSESQKIEPDKSVILTLPDKIREEREQARGK
ncbi:MAG: hypothetical protein IKG47_03655, partial [Oscillospiraceae bacterium]|nr:hypothetical protein [Oscillospiraceae bacterium]